VKHGTRFLCRFPTCSNIFLRITSHEELSDSDKESLTEQDNSKMQELIDSAMTEMVDLNTDEILADEEL
jgi:hypothetical protein